ncbi:MAG: hypothetical protein QOF73_4411 [Thermomicrobiales bacterium]|jgi:plastocyanin|nr:hypothetical protein [Thermomicrobiales bacterium]
MRRLLVPVVAAFVLVLGLGTFAVAQDATPTGMEEHGNPCLEAMGTPAASPGAMTEEATEPATITGDGSPVASPAAGEGCEAKIEGFAFVPATIHISVGETVTWENYDDAPHTATGDNGEFDSGRLDKGATFSHTFTSAGTFSYHCDYHPNMKATIIVS